MNQRHDPTFTAVLGTLQTKFRLENREMAPDDRFHITGYKL